MAVIPRTLSVSRRRSLFLWALAGALAGGVFLAYLAATFQAGHGEPLMPLDDVYIHFQYARQLARGEPYVYNPGLQPTSGATSFLYPYLLAPGVLLGLDGLDLGVWAMGLGAAALAGSIWLIYHLARRHGPAWAALLVAVLFPLAGPVAWHYMSGMETGLVVLFLLLTLYGFVTRHLMVFVTGATLLSLIRPEGGILSLLAVAAYVLAQPYDGAGLRAWLARRAELAWLVLPVLAIVVQPAVNLLVTGSAVASGNQAKSVFGMVPPYHDAIIGAILANALRMVVELLTGYSPREGFYFPFVLSLLTVVCLIYLLRSRQHRLTGLLLVAWLAAGIVAIATLETAFWHFKRYQMPLIALLFPLAAWGIGFWPRRAQRAAQGLAALAAVLVLLTALPFYQHYRLNVAYVYQQPLQMARWLAANTPQESVVAVHDTGMMRYMGGRTTLDMVGLTTPGAAAAWRNGPGAVAEFLENTRPDYIASYGEGHGFGLGYLAATSLYGRELARYDVTLDPDYNVALAAPYQGIYAPEWGPLDGGEHGPSPVVQRLVLAGRGAKNIAAVDVADLISERTHGYRWRDSERLGGFPTDVYDMIYAGCTGVSCRVVDAGRRINGEESFEFFPDDSAGSDDVLLVTRLHPVNAGAFDVYVNGALVATRWIPALPGSWLDVPTLIPGEFVTLPTQVRIVPRIPGGHYMPYHHWLYTVEPPVLPEGEPFATFQDGLIELHNPRLELVDEGRALHVAMTWASEGGAQGDHKVFVHVLDPSGNTVAQADVRPGLDTLPPGNWVAGAFADTVVVDLTGVSAGRYEVAMGLYDPVTFARLAPTGGDDARRLILGTVEIGDNG